MESNREVFLKIIRFLKKAGASYVDNKYKIFK